MKTYTLKNQHISYYADIQASQDLNIIMQLYYIAKTEASERHLPKLPSDDFRQRVCVPAPGIKPKKMNFKELIAGHLHALKDPLFKRTAA